MDRISKDEYYLGIALAVSKRSTCIKRHYGCVIVKDDVIVATGYNGSTRGERNCCDDGTCLRIDKPHNTGDYSDCCSVHAEQNALLSAGRERSLGATLYLAGEEYSCTHKSNIREVPMYVEVLDCEPCPICSRMAKNAGITKVVTKQEN